MTGYLDWLLLQETFGTLEIPYAIANRHSTNTSYDGCNIA